MKFLTAAAVALLAVTVCGKQADAVSAATAAPAQGQEELGPALPPIGFVRYCMDNTDHCQPRAGVSAIVMTQAQWREVFRVNTLVNNKIAPVSDQDLYGEVERWTLPSNAGDCEDYALLKQDYLERIGFPASALRLTVVMDENNEGHAVLTVVTTEGDYVLDNRRNDVLRAALTKYTFLKRQSAANPRQWVSLAKQPPHTSGTVLAGALKK